MTHCAIRFLWWHLAPRCQLSIYPPLSAKNGRELQILIPCRVSDPDKQDERSLDDQIAMGRRFFEANTDLSFRIDPLEGRGGGENLDRAQQLLDESALVNVAAAVDIPVRRHQEFE